MIPGPTRCLRASRSRISGCAHRPATTSKSSSPSAWTSPSSSAISLRLVQIRRATKDRCLRGERPTLDPHPRRVHEVRRAAEHIDGGTPKPERDAILERAGDRRNRACFELHGADRRLGHARCRRVILARPTKKMGLYRQMIGRGLRPAQGKNDAIVLDHSGAVFRHGFVEDPVEWTLDPGRKGRKRMSIAERGRHRRTGLLECTNCGALRVGGDPCAHCGYIPQRARGGCVRRRRTGWVSRAAQREGLYDRPTRDSWHGCLSASRRSAAISPDGPPTSTRKSSAPGRSPAPSNRCSRHPKSGRGCAAA